MSRWFRFYDDSLNDPKVQLLPNWLFKAWVNILCLASKNGGQIVPDQIAFALRCSGEEAAEILNLLNDAELIDNIDGKITPHNWSGRQYDNRDGANRLAGAAGDSTAAARMQRHRNKERNANRNTTVTDTVTQTATEPYQEQNRTEQNRKKDVRPAVVEFEKEFGEFWKLKPKRKGANPRIPALKAYGKAVRSGCDPGEINAAAKKWAAEFPDPTEFVPMAVTWLNQRRFLDYQSAADGAVTAVSDEFMRTKGFIWDGEKWAKQMAAE